MKQMIHSAFELGAVISTATVHEQLINNSHFDAFVKFSVFRHSQLNWGECCEQDKLSNEEALKKGYRIFSVYTIPEDLKNTLGINEDAIWVITEANRSSTCILFPSEY